MLPHPFAQNKKISHFPVVFSVFMPFLWCSQFDKPLRAPLVASMDFRIDATTLGLATQRLQLKQANASLQRHQAVGIQR